MHRSIFEFLIAPHDFTVGQCEAGGSMRPEMDEKPLAIGYGRRAGVAVLAMHLHPLRLLENLDIPDYISVNCVDADGPQ